MVRAKKTLTLHLCPALWGVSYNKEGSGEPPNKLKSDFKKYQITIKEASP
jgi:hypothetical protein